jgi:NAD(P)H-flavin reductase
VPNVVKEVIKDTENAVVIVCGPPIMLKFTIPVLIEAGFDQENIYTSLERRMSCGLGKCGKCNVCSKYVCKDGPVFKFSEVRGVLD